MLFVSLVRRTLFKHVQRMYATLMKTLLCDFYFFPQKRDDEAETYTSKLYCIHLEYHCVRALVLSRIAYGNLLLIGATSYELDRVQR